MPARTPAKPREVDRCRGILKTLDHRFTDPRWRRNHNESDNPFPRERTQKHKEEKHKSDMVVDRAVQPEHLSQGLNNQQLIEGQLYQPSYASAENM